MQFVNSGTGFLVLSGTGFSPGGLECSQKSSARYQLVVGPSIEASFLATSRYRRGCDVGWAHCFAGSSWTAGNEAVVIEMSLVAWMGEDGERITAQPSKLGRLRGADSARAAASNTHSRHPIRHPTPCPACAVIRGRSPWGIHPPLSKSESRTASPSRASIAVFFCTGLQPDNLALNLRHAAGARRSSTAKLRVLLP